MSEYRIVNGRQSQVDAHTGQLLSRETGGGSDYVLPTATTTVKGGVKVGAHLSMNGQTLNADDQSYDDSAIVSRLDDLGSDVASLDAEKQDGLVSGTSIKTVNGESLLGSGNIEIDGGESDYVLPTATTTVKGGVKVGAHLSMNGQTLNADDQSYDDSAIVSRLDDLGSDVASLDAEKQDGLVSGTSIKTVNGESLLGSGNIEIDGGGSDYVLPTATRNVLGGMKTTKVVSSGTRIGTIGPASDNLPEMYSWTPKIESDYEKNNWGGKSAKAGEYVDYVPKFADPLVYCGPSTSGVRVAVRAVANTPSGAYSKGTYVKDSTSVWDYVRISNETNKADVNCILVPFAVVFKNTATGDILTFFVTTNGNNPNAYVAATQLPNASYTYAVYYHVVDVSRTL